MHVKIDGCVSRVYRLVKNNSRIDFGISQKLLTAPPVGKVSNYNKIQKKGANMKVCIENLKLAD